MIHTHTTYIRTSCLQHTYIVRRDHTYRSCIYTCVRYEFNKSLVMKMRKGSDCFRVATAAHHRLARPARRAAAAAAARPARRLAAAARPAHHLAAAAAARPARRLAAAARHHQAAVLRRAVRHPHHRLAQSLSTFLDLAPAVQARQAVAAQAAVPREQCLLLFCVETTWVTVLLECDGSAWCLMVCVQHARPCVNKCKHAEICHEANECICIHL